MADETPAPATGAPDEAENPDAPDGDTSEQLGDAGKKALEAERKARREAEARVKALEPLAERLQALEDQSKTDEEKAAEALTAAATRAEAAELELARYRAAVEHGLAAEDIALLGDGTPDEISERAATLASRLASVGKPSKPAPNPAQGAAGSPSLSTADQFAAALDGLL